MTALVQAPNFVSNYSATSLTADFSTATTPGNCICVALFGWSGTVTISDGVNSYSSPSNVANYLWYVTNAASVSSVTASWTSGAFSNDLWIAEFSGVATSGALVDDEQASGTFGSTPQQVTTNVDSPGLVFALVTNGGGGSAPSGAGSGMDLLSADSTNETLCEYAIIGSGTTFTSTWTPANSGYDWSIYALSLQGVLTSFSDIIPMDGQGRLRRNRTELKFSDRELREGSRAESTLRARRDRTRGVHANP